MPLARVVLSAWGCLALTAFVGCEGCRSEPPKQPQAVTKAQTPKPTDAPPPSIVDDGRPPVGYEVLRPGTGEATLGPDDVGVFYITGSGEDGRMFLVTEPGQPRTYRLRDYPAALRNATAGMKVGEKRRYVVTPSAFPTGRPKEWPAGKLTFESELVSFAPSAPGGVQALPNPTDAPPEAAGPPAAARRAPGGLRYVPLATNASGASITRDERVPLEITGWAVAGLFVERVFTRRPTTLSPASAPAGIREVLLATRRGERVRVWVPAEEVPALVPSVVARPLVLDIAVLAPVAVGPKPDATLRTPATTPSRTP